jgi:hypothetical protein
VIRDDQPDGPDAPGICRRQIFTVLGLGEVKRLRNGMAVASSLVGWIARELSPYGPGAPRRPTTILDLRRPRCEDGWLASIGWRCCCGQWTYTSTTAGSTRNSIRLLRSRRPGFAARLLNPNLGQKVQPILAHHFADFRFRARWSSIHTAATRSRPLSPCATSRSCKPNGLPTDRRRPAPTCSTGCAL